MTRILGNTLTQTLVRNFLIQFFWWVIFFPGLFSTDSFSAISQAQSGDFSNAGTATWALYLRFFSFHGNFIPALTIISALSLTYAVTCLAFTIFPSKIASISSTVLVATPLVYAMGITLWHDIPFSAGLILITSYFSIKLRKNEIFQNSTLQLFLPGVIFLTFRPNGIPTLIIFSLIYILIVRDRKQSIYVIPTIIIVTLINVSMSHIFLKQPTVNMLFAQEFMREDISCFASLDRGKGFVEENLAGISNTSGWSSKDACTFISRSSLTLEEKNQAVELLPRAWFKLVLEEPIFVLNTHLKRHAYLNPIPLYGIPVAPFIHSNIEFTDRGINWAFPQIAEKARILPKAWNAARGLLGWAGLWFLILLIISLRKNNSHLLPYVVMSISLIILLFIVAPIPDGRYTLFVLITGQMVFLGESVKLGLNFKQN